MTIKRSRFNVIACCCVPLLAIEQHAINRMRDGAIGVDDIAILPACARNPHYIPFIGQRIDQRVLAIPARELEHIIACTAGNNIITCTTRQNVIAVVAVDPVIAAPAADRVIAITAIKRVIPVRAQHDIIAAVARNRVIAQPAIAKIIARKEIYNIIARPCMDEIIARRANNRLRSARSEDKRIKIGQPHFIAVRKLQRLDLVKGVEPVLQYHAVARKHTVGPQFNNQIKTVRRFGDLDILKPDPRAQHQRILAARRNAVCCHLRAAAVPVVEPAIGKVSEQVASRRQSVKRGRAIIGLFDNRVELDPAFIAHNVSIGDIRAAHITNPENILIIPAPAVEDIGKASPARQNIPAVAAFKRILAVTAFKPVRAFAPNQQIIASPAVEVIAVPAQRPRRNRACIERIIPVTAQNPVIKPPAIKIIITRPAKDIVAKVRGVNRVIAIARINRRRDINHQLARVRRREGQRGRTPSARPPNREHRLARCLINNHGIDKGVRRRPHARINDRRRARRRHCQRRRVRHIGKRSSPRRHRRGQRKAFIALNIGWLTICTDAVVR